MAESNYRPLSDDALDFIKHNIRVKGVMNVEEVENMIRPHYIPDHWLLVDRDIHTRATNILRRIRDEDGTRTCFAVKSDGTYVNVEKCEDADKLREVDEMLAKQAAGIQKSRNKTLKRRQELEGQLSMEEA